MGGEQVLDDTSDVCTRYANRFSDYWIPFTFSNRHIVGPGYQRYRDFPGESMLRVIPLIIEVLPEKYAGFLKYLPLTHSAIPPKNVSLEYGCI